MARRKKHDSEEFEYRRSSGSSLSPSSFGAGPAVTSGDGDDGGQAKPWWRLALWGLVFVALLATPLRVLLPALSIYLGLDALLSPRSKRRATPAPRERLKAPYRELVEQGQAVRAEIQAVIEGLPNMLRGTFEPLAEQVSDLVADLETLAHAAQMLDAYLDSPHAHRTTQEMQQLQAEIRRCEDAFAREQFQQALHALEEALADQKEIRTLSERAKAVAAHINASLESVFAEVIKQRYSDLDTARGGYDSAAAHLQAVKDHVDAVQQVIIARPVSGQ